ncbi:hypothetical protein [Clostridium estertheticum]|uniref:Uncharacterized protein n=1 Tax=Clostridium estertheticum TaxID=238834 RepID=A0A7Y3SSS6_9CLOT|nr:hypothetical protein [Clostridium estertheticum]NNU74694.1 hypothetical protein [Clostridium estertheticum]WBL48816.1 hypothetical protein LOR37_09210 [Clostridium estertheticum]
MQQIVTTWNKEVKRAVGIQRAVSLVEAAKISIGIKEKAVINFAMLQAYKNIFHYNN